MVDDTQDRPSPLPQSMLSRRVANYVRFTIKNVFILVAIALVCKGSPWIYAIPVIAGSLLVVAEELIADIDAKEDMPPIWYLNIQLWLSLPLLIVLTIAVLNLVGPGIPLIDALLSSLGFDPQAARASLKFTTYIALAFSVGSLYGLAGQNVAHELVHRTSSLFDLVVGRMLLAFTFDTGYAIDHVYGHHRLVGTEADASTARRGEYILAFVARAFREQNRDALHIESERLKRKNIPNLPWNNRFWRGQMISVAYVAIAFAIGGWKGMALFIACGLMGKAYHTCITYVEHYGLVRVPGTSVQPRHAWNSNRRVSLGMLYNTPLHAEHHMFANRPFWQLHKVDEKAPLMPYGSIPMFLIALSPHAWKRVITPCLKEWDEKFASPEERAYLQSKGTLLG